VGLLRWYSRMFPGPWQLAFGIGVVALFIVIGGFVWEDFTPTAFIVPAAFLGIAWVKRSYPK
jgi:hypothetical protein